MKERVVPENVFPTWHAIDVGGSETRTELRRALATLDYHVDPWAFNLMKRKSFDILPERQSIDLVKLEIGEIMEADGGVSQSEIWEVIDNHPNLKRCPIETFVRLAMERERWDITTDHRFEVVTKHITDALGHKRQFQLERLHDGRPSIYTHTLNRGICFSGYDIVVTRR